MLNEMKNIKKITSLSTDIVNERTRMVHDFSMIDTSKYDFDEAVDKTGGLHIHRFQRTAETNI